MPLLRDQSGLAAIGSPDPGAPETASARIRPDHRHAIAAGRERLRAVSSRRLVQFALNGMLWGAIVLTGSVGFPSQGQAIDPQYHDEFMVDGVSRSLKSWWSLYQECRRDSDVEKGEFETREEFEARRAQLVKNCDTMWPLKNAVASQAVGLSYDSDSETLSFGVDLGDTGRPAGVWGLDFIPSNAEAEYWRRMCDAGVACERDGKFYYYIVCWVVDPHWQADFRASRSANAEFLDAEPGIKVWQSWNENLSSTEQTERICMNSNDWRIEVTAKADIDKARKLKTVEPSLRMEFTGRSVYHSKIAGSNHWYFWMFYIQGMRLINQEDGSEVFSLVK